MKNSVTKEYTRVKVEGILNLEEFSGAYEMTPEEMVSFHNQCCGLQELLTVSLPKYVEYVYIPADKYQNREDKLLKSSTLSFPSLSSDKVYGVMIRFIPKDLQIHYRIKVKRNTSFTELIKERTFVNNQGIDKIIEQLFEKAEQVLYPLQISADKKGAFGQITNHKEIKERWKTETFPRLKEYYQSETTDKILEDMDVAYSDLNQKKELFNRNIFYTLFFLPVYQTYPDFFRKDFLEVFFSGISRSVRYDTEYWVSREYTKGNKIALNIKGVEEEDPFNKNSPKGQIDLLYKFDRETGHLFSIAGFLSTFEKNTEYKIDFQLYEQ
ncbi:hypothetical protein [Chryseobacterium pennipullorum]|uniref:Uncharacterized protein n=1 Tax=Chryseobacterium pennipullorum TaxID=2258963 RepID=A0A3D9AXU5_9FLAO|nr:hypothetical protein [Chryseobacterium pennipullorum]REC46154.1 hypothetical protein DRF67_15485 [Chryseobacterium pennipullorum]